MKLSENHVRIARDFINIFPTHAVANALTRKTPDIEDIFNQLSGDVPRGQNNLKNKTLSYTF